MKVMLELEKPRQWQGTVVQVLRFPFWIGREPGCDLRADSSTISARHCALVVRADKVFVSDVAGNPTFVNDHQVQGEQEVHDLDCVKVGRLQFTIRVQSSAVEHASVPPAPAAENDEEAAGSLLLALEEPGGSTAASSAAETLPAPQDTHKVDRQPTESAQSKPRPVPSDTAAAARNLLARFRKPRGPGVPRQAGA